MLIQPTMWLVIFTITGYWWLIFEFLSTRSFSEKHFPNQSVTRKYHYTRLFHPRCRAWHLPCWTSRGFCPLFSSPVKMHLNSSPAFQSIEPLPHLLSLVSFTNLIPGGFAPILLGSEAYDFLDPPFCPSGRWMWCLPFASHHEPLLIDTAFWRWGWTVS